MDRRPTETTVPSESTTAQLAEGPIVVFGGTGHYGQNAVRALLRKGQPVRVLSRSAERARAQLGDAVEVVEGDITDPSVVTAALEGARGVVIAVAAMTAKLIRRRSEIERDAVLEVLRQAEEAGIRRVVYLSVYDIDEEFLAEHGLEEAAQNHRAVEAALRASRLNWTILGCSPSFEFFFLFLEKGAVPGRGERKNPTMAPQDVGEVAAQAALREDLSGRRFRMTGPEAMHFSEAAARAGEAVGRPFTYRNIPLGLVRVVSVLARPFTPFVRFIWVGMTLHDRFPEGLVAEVPQDHRLLLDTFDFEPTSFEDAARARFPGDSERS